MDPRGSTKLANLKFARSLQPDVRFVRLPAVVADGRTRVGQISRARSGKAIAAESTSEGARAHRFGASTSALRWHAVNAQLAQLLRYLERDGVTEVALRVGQPVSMRTANGVTNVTARALSNEQLQSIIRDSELAALVAARVQDESIELQLGTRSVVARVTRRDDGVAVTLSRALPPPPAEPPVELVVEDAIEPPVKLAIEPPVEYEIDLGTEPPVRRNVEFPRAAPVAHSAPPRAQAASFMRGPPPLGPGIELDLSFDDLPDFADDGSPPAPARPAPAPAPPQARNPVGRESGAAVQRTAPRTGPDRQDLRPTAGAFQRVDLRDARSPTPNPDPPRSAEDSSAWFDIDLAPPSRKR